MSLYYRKIEGGPKPVLILHGIFGSSDNWLTISKQIASSKHTVYLIDQRNHGRSPRADEFNYATMSEDLRGFIVEHQLQHPILIGHSMGGKTVMQYTSEWPSEVDKLVVVDIAPKAYPIHHTEILKGLAAIQLGDLQSRQEANEILSAYEPSEGVRQFLLKNLYKKEHGGFDWRINLPVLSRDMAMVGQATEPKHPIDVPTLFMRGEKSNYILDSDWDSIHAHFPNATLATVPDAGHWIQAEQPAAFLQALHAFLDA